ncbi:MAG: hypothetical protein ACJAZI_000396 [Cycloclasticus sp.]|jgi:hypothetical protein
MRTIFFILSLCVIGITQAEVYKYINKQGKTAYSDVPIAGAEKIIVPPVMTYQPIEIKEVKPSDPQTKDEPARDISDHQMDDRTPYQTMTFVNLKDELTLQNVSSISVQYSLQPSLQNDDGVVLYLNGKAQEGLTLTNLSRGSLSLRLAVLDREGEELISSEEITIYIQKHSILTRPPKT